MVRGVHGCGARGEVRHHTIGKLSCVSMLRMGYVTYTYVIQGEEYVNVNPFSLKEESLKSPGNIRNMHGYNALIQCHVFPHVI